MGQVNRIPNGFLDLLGVQSLGRNPPLFSDAVSPTVDLTEYYSAQTLSSHTEDFTHTAADQQVVVFVPEGETWLLRGFSVYTTPLGSVSESEDWSFMVQNLARGSTGGATSEPVLWNTGRLSPIIANNKVAAAFMLPAPLMMTSGSVTKARLTQRDATPVRATDLTWIFNRYNS